MLRAFVLLLILLNAGYFAWSQGLLQTYGWAPAEQREPQRVAQQLRPEAIRILPAPSAPTASLPLVSAPPPAAPEAAAAVPQCQQAGPLDVTDAAQLESLRQTLTQTLPAGSWTLDSRVTAPARWIVYMGRFANAAELDRRRAQLSARTRRNLQTLDNPELQPGLSLARFETQAKAQAELDAMQKRGLRSARVVQEWPERKQTWLRVQLENPSDAVAARVVLQALPALNGKPLNAC